LQINALYEFGKFRFDPGNHLLLSDGRPIALTPKGFDVLLVLVQNGARLTSKEELMSKVWPDSFVEEANLTVNISALRKVLSEADAERVYIETVPKKGYRFIMPIKEARDEKQQEPAGLEAAEARERSQRAEIVPPAASPQRASSTVRLKALRPAAVGISLLALIGSASFVAFRGRLTIPSISAAKTHRLAVLPFQNLRENAESDFIGFSLADGVITKLGYVSEVVVRPSYAVEKYKGQLTDLSKVAAELKADTLLTGTFLRDGDDLRIACQLIDVKTQNILWKGRFDVKYDKLLSVQDSVATQIISGLELTLSPPETARLKSTAAISPLAYEYYLRGIDLYATGDFPVAIKMLEKATELAPNYPPAWANLGKSYNASASFRFGGSEQYHKAQEAFERSIALQPDQIEARVYMANMFTDTGRVEKAVPLLREALKTNPNHAEVHWELGYAYRFAGMLKESVAECEQARQLDPVVKLTSSALNGYLYLGQYDKFLESLPRTDDSALIAFYRGLGEYYEKNWEAAAKDFDRASELDRSLLQAQIGEVLALGIRQQRTRGLGILWSLEARIQKEAVGDPEASYKIAQAYAALGDQQSGLRVLEHSIETGFFAYPYFLTDPLLDDLRSTAKFDGVVNKARQRHESFVKMFF